MELVRCENGHFYDADRFSECPHCNPSTFGGQSGTIPLDPGDPGKSSEDEITEDNNATVGFYDWDETDIVAHTQVRLNLGGPVVGWVVATDGIHRGQDFPLKAGRNFIGRSKGMDIALEDKTISRERHAVIVFEPKSNTFLVMPGDAHELFYLNGEVVLSAQSIKAYDVISIGKTQLTFIPFCGENFSWNLEDKDKSKE